MPTKIPWCDETLNPLGWGCYGPGGTPEKPAVCPGCYAARMAKRGLRDCPDCRAFCPHWHAEQLLKLSMWKKPRVIFMQDMGDLWHPSVSSLNLLTVLGFECGNHHTFIHLTKNPARYLSYLYGLPENAYYGATVRNQEEADRLLPHLLKLPILGLKVFLSIEPMWGRIFFDARALQILSGVICGGQTGPGARGLIPDWVRSLRDQCATAGVPFFFKQWGDYKGPGDWMIPAGRILDGRTHDDLPWRVRE